MKKQNQGVLGVDRVRDRGSWAILTQNFFAYGRASPHQSGGRSGGDHSFLAERCSERPGAVKGAPAVGRGAANP